MINDKEFVDRYRAAANGRLPTGMTDSWEQMVEFCEEGYDDNIYEYENDLSARNHLEHVLAAESLRGVKQMEWVRAKVAETDARFRAILGEVVPGREHRPWWEAAMPKHAGPELADDLNRYYGLIVEVRDSSG